MRLHFLEVHFAFYGLDPSMWLPSSTPPVLVREFGFFFLEFLKQPFQNSTDVGTPMTAAFEYWKTWMSGD